jgi:hypothetical protein
MQRCFANLSRIYGSVFTYVPVLASHISSGFRIIIITVVVAAFAAYFAPVQEEKEEVKP